MSGEKITIRGARQNNLKDVSLEIAHERLTVFTGVSGSGKSSLAFDTLFAEGQRLFVESQSTYARQFLQRLDKPDVDSIEGLRPAIAVRSKNTYRTSRSTVGTVTEIYDYLRLIYSKIGKLICPDCGNPVSAATTDEMIDAALEKFSGGKVYVLAPLDFSEKMTPELLREAARARGYSYILAGDGPAIDLESADEKTLSAALSAPAQKSAKKNRSGSPESRSLFIVVDRLTVSPHKRKRIADSIETAVREGDGVFAVQPADGGERLFLTSRPQCLKCGTTAVRPSPQQLSFNSALGACPACKGFGDTYEIDMDAVVPDKTKSLRDGAIECWETRGIRKYAHKMFNKDEDELGVRPDVPFEDLSEEELDRLMKGKGELYGIEQFFDEMRQKSYKASNRFFLSRYRTLRKCRECGGTRLNPVALSALIGGKDIAELGSMPVSDLHDFFRALDLSASEREAVKLPLDEVASRTKYLRDIGLGYLTLWRLSRTLSGGEMQRIHLAGHLGSRLTGTLYALDEPTVGLHPRDTDRLIRVLKDIRDLGNTVVVVEHDLQVMNAADDIVDIGPGPGERGGEIVFSGPLSDFKSSAKTLTADYLTGRKKVSDFKRQRPAAAKKRGAVIVKNARLHNLKNIDVAFPVGLFTCVTGVSGSGKSTLVCDLLHPLVASSLDSGDGPPEDACGGVSGEASISFVEMTGQDPPALSPRANCLTYLGVFSNVRQLFADTDDARRRGLGPGAFSFNTPEGRCPKCEGAGFVQIDMQFLADILVACDACDGSRFLPNVLSVRYKDKNINDILSLTASEAIEFFAGTKPLIRKLVALEEVGLGYIRIGQPLNTMSGGELQRLKISRELGAARGETGLYIFDEPTMGLHCYEVAKFLSCVDKLVSGGHTVVVIEHNLDVIAQADHVIDLGPEGGDAGGRVVAAGTPADIAACPDSVTGAFLAPLLKKSPR
ncbi:MAG TPA: excinuclease ABC subunit UvrA [bacterium]|nr:excinuclease ABC subunit UvrA [bacterium]